MKKLVAVWMLLMAGSTFGQQVTGDIVGTVISLKTGEKLFGARAVVDDNGYLKLIKVVNPGYNYTETPNVVIEAQSNDSNCHFCCKT
jgi:hypothetical protein